LVLDEAYETFADMKSGLEYVRDHDHVVVQRTFSKASGIAAARLGYVIASPEVTQWLFRVKTLSDINVLALAAAEYLLDEPQVVASYVADVLDGKQVLNDRLPALGITVTPSEANFLHMQLPDGFDLAAVRDAMRERGFLIRITGDGLPATLAGCVRITVGPAQQMSEFVTALSLTMDELR